MFLTEDLHSYDSDICLCVGCLYVHSYMQELFTLGRSPSDDVDIVMHLPCNKLCMTTWCLRLVLGRYNLVPSCEVDGEENSELRNSGIVKRT